MSLLQTDHKLVKPSCPPPPFVTQAIHFLSWITKVADSTI